MIRRPLWFGLSAGLLGRTDDRLFRQIHYQSGGRRQALAVGDRQVKVVIADQLIQLHDRSSRGLIENRGRTVPN